MKRLLTILLVFFALNLSAQYRVTDWKTYVRNVVMVGVDTFQFEAEPIDLNDPGAINKTIGNYFVDFAGNRYKIIDSTSTTITVRDEFSTGKEPQTDQIGRVYQSVGNGEANYIGGVDITSVDNLSWFKILAADNELFWRQMSGNIDSIGNVDTDGYISTYKGGVFVDSFYVGVGGSIPTDSASTGHFYTDVIPVTGLSMSVNYPDSMVDINYSPFVWAYTIDSIDGKEIQYGNKISNFVKRIGGFDLELGKAEGFIKYIASDTLVNIVVNTDTMHLYSGVIPVNSTSISVEYPESLRNLNYFPLIQAWNDETVDGKTVRANNKISNFVNRIDGFDLELGKGTGWLQYFVSDTMHIYPAGGTGEIQTILINGDTLFLNPNGGYAILPVNLDNDSTNEIQFISIVDDTIKLSDGGGFIELPIQHDSVTVTGENYLTKSGGQILNAAKIDSVNLATNVKSFVSIWSQPSVNYFTKADGILYPTTLTDKFGIGISPTNKFTVKDSMASEYAVKISNKHSSGMGIYMEAGNSTGGDAIYIRNYNNTSALFTLYGSGIVNCMGYQIKNNSTSILLSGSSLQFKDAYLTKTLSELWENTGGWTSASGYVYPTTITDEVRIGTITDLGAEKLQVNGGIAMFDAEPTRTMKDTDWGTGFNGQQYRDRVSAAHYYFDYMNSAGSWINMLDFNSTNGITSNVPFIISDLLTSDSVKLASGATINEFSIDGSFAGNSDLAVPTEKAVKTALDTKLNTNGSAANLTSFPTLNQNTTGTAAKLTTARDLYGFSFDGSAGTVSGTNIIGASYGGTGNGFTKFTGAVTSEKTYTLPNTSTTILTKYYMGLNATGIAKITTSTGEITTAVAADFPALPYDYYRAWALKVNGTLRDSVLSRGTLNIEGTGGTTATFNTNKVTISSPNLSYGSTEYLIPYVNSTKNGFNYSYGMSYDSVHQITGITKLTISDSLLVGNAPNQPKFSVEATTGNVVSNGIVTSDVNRVQSVTSTMDYNLGAKGDITLTDNTIITINNLPDGFEGKIFVTQMSPAKTCTLNGGTNYSNEKIMGNRNTMDTRNGKVTMITYERHGSTLYYGYVYEN